MKAKRVGRPPKLKEKGTTVGAHVPVSMAQLLEEVAKAQDKSVSDVVREALELYLKEEAVRLGLQNVIQSQNQLDSPCVLEVGAKRIRPLERRRLEQVKEKLSQLETMVRELQDFREQHKQLELKPSEIMKAIRYDTKARSIFSTLARKYRDAWNLHDELERLMTREQLRELIPENWEERLVSCWKLLRQLHYFYNLLEQNLRSVQ